MSMKSEFVAENGIEYILVGDYYLPNLILPEESRTIGTWGRLHWDYLKEYRPIQYTNLITEGTLWTYLAALNEQARDRMERIIEQMKESEGVTEALKAADQLAWVGAMNSIRNRAEEIIREEMIFV